MIEISFGKLVLLALIALIVLGPEKLPGAARTLGALLRRVRNGWDSVRAEVERELQIEEIKRAAREAAERADAAQAELDATLRQVRDPQSYLADGERAAKGEGAGEAAADAPARVTADAPPAAAATGHGDTAAEEAPAATGDLFAGNAGRPGQAVPATATREMPHGDA
ncbi:preprotein translocase subunit TatA [Frateuria sp. Soil773]|uniref:Sec-independent protein translocase protein TatB n=1 Tax=Frateuria sp. Soil773 TaxID=1736407 RepID=UPI0006FE3BA0|nr:Sec-independent protein translocase protein TatB [Frateuria sp. Soil773]KRE96616.1 preprotein translocase subunit TatA [Frateuria sp. Soil773]